MNIVQRQALERLIAIAKRDTGQCRRVANFLLSWFNGPVCGGWDVTDVWSLDPHITRDIFIVLALISERPGYPDALGYDDDFQVVARLWRSHLLKPVSMTNE